MLPDTVLVRLQLCRLFNDKRAAGRLALGECGRLGEDRESATAKVASADNPSDQGEPGCAQSERTGFRYDGDCVNGLGNRKRVALIVRNDGGLPAGGGVFDLIDARESRRVDLNGQIGNEISPGAQRGRVARKKSPEVFRVRWRQSLRIGQARSLQIGKLAAGYVAIRDGEKERSARILLLKPIGEPIQVRNCATRGKGEIDRESEAVAWHVTAGVWRAVIIVKTEDGSLGRCH